MNYHYLFCHNIKELRRINRLSKREMAKKLHIRVRSLNKIERGILSENITVEILFALKSEFDINPQDMFTDLFASP